MGPVLHSTILPPSPSASHRRETYDSFLSLLDPSSSSSQGKYDKRETKDRPTTHLGSGKDVSSMDAPDRLKRIRRLVLTEGIPELPSTTSLRPLVWKLLLQVDVHLDVEDYLRLVACGPSWLNAKIKNDTFRTLATDQTFKSVVSDEMLERLLEAFVWRNDSAGSGSGSGAVGGHEGSGSGSGSGQEMQGRAMASLTAGEAVLSRGNDRSASDPTQISYVQGMNVLSAPLLYVLPSQIEAYACFTRLIENQMPGYVGRVLGGVHAGLKLLDRSLQAVDEELFNHLKSKNLSAELYAFPSVLTLSACTPPLPEVLKLWDFLLAFGVHLNVLCVIAQMMLMRQELMESASPMKLLRIFPPLNAQAVIGITVALVKDLSDDLYAELVRHPLVN